MMMMARAQNDERVNGIEWMPLLIECIIIIIIIRGKTVYRVTTIDNNRYSIICQTWLIFGCQ